jgi:hypothetical protein
MGLANYSPLVRDQVVWSIADVWVHWEFAFRKGAYHFVKYALPTCPDELFPSRPHPPDQLGQSRQTKFH